jgi:hypothetical protein
MGFTQSVQLHNVECPDVFYLLDHFTNAVVQATAMNIPWSSIRPRRVPVPLWTVDCSDAIRARKRALKQFQIHPIQENLVSFKRLRAAARRTIRSAKRRSWVAYVASLSRSTPSYVVWQRLSSMSGKCRSTTVPGLSVNGVAITSQCDVANALAASFASASSSDRYDPTFLWIKVNAESSPLHFNSRNLECYNAPFSMDELLLAIGRSRNTSPGPDGSTTRCCLTSPLLRMEVPRPPGIFYFQLSPRPSFPRPPGKSSIYVQCPREWGSSRFCFKCHTVRYSH